MNPPNTDDSPLLIPPQIAFSEDLTWAARRANLHSSPYDGDPFYETVFEQLARALHRRERPNILMVGERGVGKSLVLAELARRAVCHKGFLSQKRFLRVDCRYCPPDEARPRLAGLMAHTAPHTDLIVAIDGFFGLIRPANGHSNKPILLGGIANGRSHLVGLVTPAEFDDLTADDPEFLDFFTAVVVPEPDAETAGRLLLHFASGLSARYHIPLSPGAVRTAVGLSGSYILNDQLPAKALRILTEACERADYNRQEGRDYEKEIGEDQVIEIVEERTGIPRATLAGLADRTDYEAALQEIVFGQDHAVRAVATELGLIKAGMSDRGKPASVLLFLGQTGTGKTELAKALARFYSSSRRLRTYTLGNCVEPHSVSTIIGVPPGYVGSDRGGRLINELNADAHGVFLLDEADKAHPDVLQPFLNVFDEGWVADQRGVRADATRSIFILTTNVGQRMIADMHRDGKGIDEITTRMKEALGQIRHSKSDRPVFTPEFLARIRRIIVFRPLDRAAFGAIARKQVEQLRREWRTGRLRELVVDEGLSEAVGTAAARMDEKSGGKEGGRIVRKLLSDWLEAPLQRAMAESPERYLSAKCVRIDLVSTTDGDSEHSPKVDVHFE